ncbi:MAG: hypothetical protein HC808_16280 [Candidatus Competibacteraceae bacterium]|nr:hypothetical protein [Candidatus Competibacteraceae bacterium]
MVNTSDNQGTGFLASVSSQQGYIRGDFGCINLVDSNGNTIMNPRKPGPTRWFTQADKSKRAIGYSLPSADDTFCVLTMVTGRFEGIGEFINVDANGSAQAIIIGSKQNDVSAGVACYYYNQG